MRAARVHRFGAPDVIAIDDIPSPEPASHEVLVRVHASGVGPWDAWIREGRSELPQPLPLTLGSDLSGRIVALGSEVRGLEIGEEIFGLTNTRFTDAHADFAAMDSARIAAKPRTLTHVEAASVPVVAVTALQMLFDHAQVRAGQRVLVHGAAGNVGAYAVQLARDTGAHVVATARGEGVAIARALGATEVVDVDRARFDELAPFDAVLDTIGGDVQRRSFDVLRPGGVLVSAVSQPDQALAAQRGARALFFLVDVTRSALEQLAERIESGELVPRVGTVLPLAEVRTAHEMLDGTRPGHGPGKIVLTVAE